MFSHSRATKEALKIILPLLAIVAILHFVPFLWAMVLSYGVFFLILFSFYFFRDPERKIPADENIIVAAADGLVVGIEELEEPFFKLGKVKRVAIFLSVFDVHINRLPVAGTVVKTFHSPGKFLDVRHPDASSHNEFQAWLLDTTHGPVAVRQIAGLIARRIVTWAKEGDALPKGYRFGMIRFGSRTEIYLPLKCEITVKLGDRVYGGSSPIARWSSIR